MAVLLPVAFILLSVFRTSLHTFSMVIPAKKWELRQGIATTLKCVNYAKAHIRLHSIHFDHDLLPDAIKSHINGTTKQIIIIARTKRVTNSKTSIRKNICQMYNTQSLGLTTWNEMKQNLTQEFQSSRKKQAQNFSQRMEIKII